MLFILSLNRPPPLETQNFQVYVLQDNLPIYFDSLFKNRFSKVTDSISNIEILKNIPDREFYSSEKIELEVKFDYKIQNEGVVLRSFLIDPLGRVVMETPKNIHKNITSDIGFIDLDKSIKFQFDLPEDNSFCIEGLWYFNTILLDKNKRIISEVTIPIKIKRFKESKSLNNMFSVNNIIFLISILIAIPLFFFQLYQTKRKKMERLRSTHREREYLRRINNDLKRSKGKRTKKK